MAKEQKPRHRRMDLINSMKPGEQKRIAKKLYISKGYVSMILNGNCNQDSIKGINVIRLAEQAAGREHGRR